MFLHIVEFRTKRKRSLKYHMLTHKTANKIGMFQCRFCEFHTKHIRLLNRNILTHKNISDIEMFRCRIFEFQTKGKGVLRRHLPVHQTSKEMFHCDYCTFLTKCKKS